jgi:hypothetical protein
MSQGFGAPQAHPYNPPLSPFIKGEKNALLPFSKGEFEGICRIVLTRLKPKCSCPIYRAINALMNQQATKTTAKPVIPYAPIPQLH